MEYTVNSTSATGFVHVVPFEELLISISNIQAQPMGQPFYIEAEVLLTNEDQQFCVLTCANCKQVFPRIYTARSIVCSSCNESAELIPKCQFEITVRDNTGSAVALISDEDAEKIILCGTQEIYEICFVKKQRLPLESAQKQLADKIFRIQVKRQSRNQDILPQKVSIISCVEKEIIMHQQMSTTKTDTTEGSQRKIEHIESVTKSKDNPAGSTQKMKTAIKKH